MNHIRHHKATTTTIHYFFQRPKPSKATKKKITKRDYAVTSIVFRSYVWFYRQHAPHYYSLSPLPFFPHTKPTTQCCCPSRSNYKPIMFVVDCPFHWQFFYEWIELYIKFVSDRVGMHIHSVSRWLQDTDRLDWLPVSLTSKKTALDCV